MIKKILLNGLLTGIFGSFVCYSYALVYILTPLNIDFTEKANVLNLFVYNLVTTMIIGLLYIGLRKIFIREHFSSFILNFLLSGIVLGLVFYQLIQPDPVFKNEDTNAMASFYNSFLLPIIFIPYLSWFTFKPLIIRLN